MDNNFQNLLQRSKEVNHEGTVLRKNGDYSSAVKQFTYAISLFPREEYFYNRALSRLATRRGIEKASESSDDMLVAMLMGYLNHADSNSQMIIESVVFYLKKMMQINLLCENGILRDFNTKVAYRNYILAEQFSEFLYSVKDQQSVYRDIYPYFSTPTFQNEFNDYFNRFAIGPFNMMLNTQNRYNWTSKSLEDVEACLNRADFIEAARNIYNLLFND